MNDSRLQDAVLGLLRDLPRAAGGSVLELGCGDAGLLETMAADGADVRGTTFRALEDDYIRERAYPATIAGRIDGGVDLNRPLPYGDGSFDLVYSTEVIEHVESHRTFITEAARVLRPGGWFVLSTPNLQRLTSRAQFALSGVHGLKRRLIPPSTPLARMEEFHCHPVDFTLLHYLMWRSGLRIRRLAVSRAKLSSLLGLILYAPIALATRSFVLRKIRTTEDRAARLDLARWMTSRALLTSEHIVLAAQKLSDAAGHVRDAVAARARSMEAPMSVA